MNDTMRQGHQFTGIQILRFVAAMLVVAMHVSQSISTYITGVGATHYWHNGSAGVDIFFVISGFVMASSTRAVSADRTRAAWLFMKKRIVRIAPLYWFYTLLKAALVLSVPALALRSTVDPGHLVASLLFVPSNSPWHDMQPLLPVGWTLNFEMFFYLVFAVAIAWGVPRIRFCLAMFLGAYLLGQHFRDQPFPGFYAESILFEFILGMCIASPFVSTRQVPRLPAAATVIAGVVLMFGIDWGTTDYRLVTWGLAAALIVVGTVWLEPWIRQRALAKPGAFLGDASYSIYLSHTFVVPAAVMALRASGVHGSVVTGLVAGLAGVAAGCGSYLWLEKPMTSWLKRTFLKHPRQEPPPQEDRTAGPSPSASTPKPRGRFIYIACPWTPKGGGMFKVADYLIQAQASGVSATATAALQPLDTRGGAHAVRSFPVLAGAMVRLVAGRLTGRLAGVHVNMAERLSLFRKSMIIVTSRLLGIPVVLHLHAAQLHHFYRRLPRPLQALTRWVFSLPSTCIVLGSASRRFVIEELRVPAHKVEIVINGVPEPVEQRRSPGAGSRQRILFVGNLSERKGVSDLLQAVAAAGIDASRVEVTIAGGGDVDAYRRKARKLGIDNLVRFTGWADQQQVARLMAGADVLVLPSYDEGLPLVILEALANGVAVVCSPVGEIPTTLTDGVDALFVEAGNVEGLALALQRVLQDPVLRQTLERNGRALYEQHFSLAGFFASVARIHQRHFGVAGQGGQPSMALREDSL
ncbi:MAG: glycosyl transferase, group 1 [Polaromonas sp.]|nr:glycosyl transferase, group 1 [Polaromonas sp.]